MNPWHAFYPGDYLRDTAHLSLVEHGAYRLLLDHYYSTAVPLPAAKPALYRIARAFEDSERAAVDTVLEQFFEFREDGYHNTRADRELAKRTEHQLKLSGSGRRGAEKRWRKSHPIADGQANSPASSQATSQANGHPNGPLMARPQPHPHPEPQPHPEPHPEQEGSRASHAPRRSAPGARVGSIPEPPSDFESFWRLFPRKCAKQDALRAWKKVRAEEVPAILAAVERWKSTYEWQCDGGRFIPYPATFLNGRRWEDQVPEPSVAGKEKPDGRDFGGTDRAAESFRRRVDDVAAKVGAGVLTGDQPN